MPIARSAIAIGRAAYTLPGGGQDDASFRYVRQGAAGSASGLDWTNAFVTLPATLTRGNTYYIADGTYGGYAFDDAVSGTTLITVKKATIASHGTATGWSDAYGDGEALFSITTGSTFTFTTSYWVIDGQVGSGKNPGTFGFRLFTTQAKSADPTLCTIGSWPTGGADNITLAHVEFDFDNGTGTSASNAPTSLNGFGGIDNLTLQHCYFHHGAAFALYIGNFTGQPESNNILIEHCYFYSHGGGGGTSAHWELFWATDWVNPVVRYNTFDSIFGATDAQTGWLMFGSCSNIKIYGNLFCGTGTTAVGNNGVIATWSADTWQNAGVLVYNNTFVDIAGGGGCNFRFTHDGAADTGVVFKNNLYYLSSAGFFDIGTHTHGAFGGGVSSNGTSAQTGLTTAIFTNYAGDVFTLASATTAGDATIGAEFSTDMNGATRGGDGSWDRGAYEFVA